MADYSPSEMMIVLAARKLAGARTVFVGVGLPNSACNLARYTVAPELELIYEAGVYGARPARLPLSIGDPSLVTGALAAVSMADLFGLYLQRGLVDVALLGGAQIDGAVSFDDLFAVSGMSRLDTARILAQMVDEGVISRG